MNNDWLDIGILEDYLDGKLDRKRMHELEKQALEDSFAAQALSGFAEYPERAGHQLSLLQKQLYERTAIQQEHKKSSVFTWQRLSVAATAAVMFITASVIFLMREKAGKAQLAAVPRQVEVNLGSALDSAALSSTDQTLAAIKAVTKRSVAGKSEKIVAITPVDAAAIIKTSRTENISDSTTTITDTSAPVATALPAVSSPLEGWANLDIYLNEYKSVNTPEGIAEIVELSFQINSAGKPVNFKVLKSAGKKLDAEAIKLLADGPLWEKTANPETRVNYTVAF